MFSVRKLFMQSYIERTMYIWNQIYYKNYIYNSPTFDENSCLKIFNEAEQIQIELNPTTDKTLLTDIILSDQMKFENSISNLVHNLFPFSRTFISGRTNTDDNRLKLR